MRLHQRVGRLNRYGQQQPVEVVTLRNPATVESLIWDKLNEKIASIMRALGSAMDEPEDLLQLVLGMTSPSLFTDLFANAATVPEERLDTWFDNSTKTFGGRDAIDTVQTLLGNCERFDYQDLKTIPPKDLPDLVPFFEAMLTLNKRRLTRDEHGLAFKTPEEWVQDPGVRRRYEGLVFSRNQKGKDAAVRVVGIGHKVFDQAIRQAVQYDAACATLPGIDRPLATFVVYDRVTSQDGHVRQIIAGVMAGQEELLRDWQLVDLLNDTLRQKKSESEQVDRYEPESLLNFIDQAEAQINRRMASLHPPFEVPETKLLSVFVPATSSMREHA